MRKIEYETPSMQVVELKQESQLLAGSSGSSLQNFGEPINEEWTMIVRSDNDLFNSKA